MSSYIIDLIHSYHEIGYEFTLEDVFEEHWNTIGVIDRNIIGTNFALCINTNTYGITGIYTSGWNIKKQGGKNKYVVTSLV